MPYHAITDPWVQLPVAAIIINNIIIDIIRIPWIPPSHPGVHTEKSPDSLPGK
jgi:hypothetical protein